jgi:IS5 family transposase
MFKVLVLQTLYTLSDDQTEYQLRDRLSFIRFVGLGLHDPVPDAKTIWLFRVQLTRAGAIERLFPRFDAALKDKGLLAMGGQILDATVVQARPARLTAEEKATIRAGKSPTGWSPARRAQIDRDARWTLKRGRKISPCRSTQRIGRGWPKGCQQAWAPPSDEGRFSTLSQGIGRQTPSISRPSLRSGRIQHSTRWQSRTAQSTISPSRWRPLKSGMA